MAALGRDARALHTGDAATDDGDLLRRFGRLEMVHLLLAHQVGVDRAQLRQTGENVADTAEVAADAGADLLVEAEAGLVRPLGISQQLTAEHDRRDLAVADGIVGHLGLQDLAAADDGHVDLPRERLDIVEPEALFLIHRRVEPVEGIIRAVAEVDRIIAGLRQLLGDVDALFGRAAVFDVVLTVKSALADGLDVLAHAQTAGHGEVLAADALDALHDLAHDLDAAVKSAVRIRAFVEARLQELVDGVAAVAVDVDAVAAGLQTQRRGRDGGVDDALDLRFRHGAVLDGGIPAVRAVRRGNALTRDPCWEVHAASAVAELDEELRAVGVHAVDELLVAGDERRRVLERVFHDDAVVILEVRLIRAGEDETDAALGARLKIIDDTVVDQVVSVRPADVVHAAHDDLVFNLQLSDVERLEQFRIFQCHKYLFLSFVVPLAVTKLTHPGAQCHLQKRRMRKMWIPAPNLSAC